MKRAYLPFSILFVLLVLMNNSIEALFVSPEMVVKKLRVFPPFKVATIANDTLNNAYFKNKKTIVILAHLGCAPAMVLLKDIQKRSDLFDYQHLIILENTKKQIEEFNADSASIWNIVNKMGMIERKVEGYPTDNTLEVRMKSLLKN